MVLVSLAIAISLGNLPRLFRDAWSFRFFYFFTILMHLIFDRGGETLLSFYFLKVTSVGVVAGFFFSIKIAIIVTLGGLFTRSTHPAALSKGVEGLLPTNGTVARRLGRPGIVVGVAMRMLPTILAESDRIRTAQIARGLKVKSSGVRNSIKNLLPLIGPLITATLRRGDTVHAAMVSRGFSLDQDRSQFIQLQMRAFDWIVLVCAVIVSFASVML